MAATAGSATTFYLPGIGEEKQDWSYYLYDGTNSARQLSSPAGQVTLTRSFTPWGELLELRGLGDFTWGYLGGLLDAATGLIYVGNGQYYDPATGRFLTRGVYPGSPNPYVPWRGDPLGMMLGPLALVALIRGKRKGGKVDQILLVLIVVMAVNLACDLPGSNPTGTPTTQPTTDPTQTGTAPAPTEEPQPTETPTPPPTKTPVTPTPCPTPTPSPTPTPMDIESILYPGEPAFNEDNAWKLTLEKYKEIRDWFMLNSNEDLDYSFDPDNYGPRFKDDVLLAFIITGEFGMFKGLGIYYSCLHALYNQYHSQDLCGGSCNSVMKQLVWLSTKQAMRSSTANFFIDHYKSNLEDGKAITQGKYGGTDLWEWGNYKKGSPFGRFIDGDKSFGPFYYADINNDPAFYNPVVESDYAGFIVFTHEQDIDCGGCLGW